MPISTIPSSKTRSSIEIGSSCFSHTTAGGNPHTRPLGSRNASEPSTKASARFGSCISSESRSHWCPYYLPTVIPCVRQTGSANSPHLFSLVPARLCFVRSCRGSQPFWIRFLRRQLSLPASPQVFCSPLGGARQSLGGCCLVVRFPCRSAVRTLNASSRLFPPPPSLLDSLFVSPPTPHSRNDRKKRKFNSINSAPPPIFISFSPA